MVIILSKSSAILSFSSWPHEFTFVLTTQQAKQSHQILNEFPVLQLNKYITWNEIIVYQRLRHNMDDHLIKSSVI